MSKTFSKWYDFFMIPLEQGKFKKIRRQLLKEATGKVLELGSGTGINFPLYDGVEVTAIEPSAHMIERSEPRKSASKVPVELIQAGAEKLPFADDTFDSVVATLVYCTIPDAEKAFAEMKRVCKNNGKILMFEHVRMRQPFLARLQERLTPYWGNICDGCRLDRDTVRLARESGLTIVQIKEYYKGLFIAMILRNVKS
ncbi:class I SAM-dependent methyltransferase [Mesobacillus foraminis]|uniref:Methyltransferase family protein n=1 Tax=Mesobacillus foraminis TaxID=279826 RepID=A0A4R2BJ31_9BACI|nr:methyltransferase domain-containing protein [Mesobacillus foraminis]TCN27131.1 methyltransferase family protein [Mesobacillus foraminis]